MLMKPTDCLKRFDRKNKQTFLNYVKIAVPRDRWPEYINMFIVVKNIPNWKEGIETMLMPTGNDRQYGYYHFPHQVVDVLVRRSKMLTDPDLIIELTLQHNTIDMMGVIYALYVGNILEKRHMDKWVKFTGRFGFLGKNDEGEYVY